MCVTQVQHSIASVRRLTHIEPTDQSRHSHMEVCAEHNSMQDVVAMHAQSHSIRSIMACNCCATRTLGSAMAD